MTRQLERATVRNRVARANEFEPGNPAATAPVASRPQSPSEHMLANLALALASGILVALPFLRPALWWLHYGALVPWIVLVTRENTRGSWVYFLAGAYTFLIMGLGALSLFHKAVPFAVAALYAPFLLPFAILLRFLYRHFRWPLILLVPMLWVATEWLRLRYSLGGVAFFPLGTSQFQRTTLIQIADFTGVYGVSFLIAAANGAVVDTWKMWQAGARTWRAAVPLGAFLLLLTAVLWYGADRRKTVELVAGPRITAVQPNILHYRDRRRALETFEAQLAFTRARVTPRSADVIAWPENAIGEPISDNPRYLQALAELARYEGAHLLIGGYTWADTPGRLHTSAYYISPEGAVVARYDKIHMIPFSEYLPFGGGLRRLGASVAQSLLGYAGTGSPGSDVTAFPIRYPSDGRMLQFAVPICFEVSNSDFARAAARRHVDFLINITSEGLLGPPMYLHMLAHSTLRAVENRIAVVRVANNALSGFIDPLGRTQLMPSAAGGGLLRAAGTLTERVPLRATGSGTFYSRYGDWLAYLCGVSTILLVAVSFARMRSSAASAPGTESRP